MIPAGVTLCKYHGEQMKGTCPGCLRAKINRLEKKILSLSEYARKLEKELDWETEVHLKEMRKK